MIFRFLVSKCSWNVAFWKVNLLIQINLKILTSSISRRDCILIMNLRRPQLRLHSWHSADSFPLLILSLFFSFSLSTSPHYSVSFLLPLHFSPFIFLSFSVSSLLSITFSLFFSFTHSLILYLSSRSLSRFEEGPFATKNNARAKMTRRVGTHR